MKTEKEIRHCRDIFKESLEQDAHCPGCQSCYARKATLIMLNWILDGNSEVDRSIENLTKMVMEDRR